MRFAEVEHYFYIIQTQTARETDIATARCKCITVSAVKLEQVENVPVMRNRLMII